MSTSSLITVTNKSDQPVVITTQAISEDGRERHANGKFNLGAGKSKDLLIDENTSLQVDTLPEVPVVAPEETQGEAE